MKGSFRKRGCKCPKERKKCTCDATWSFRIDVGIDPKTGERKQKEKGGFKTRADAAASAAKLFTEINEGSYVAETEILFKDFIPEWLKFYQATGKVKAGTVRVREKRIRAMFQYFSHLKMKNISKKMYQDMLIDLKDKGYAHETLISTHSTGKLIFNKARELDIIKNNPTENAIIPVKQKSVAELEDESEIPKYLEKEELAKLLNTALENGLDIDYPVFFTLAYTGVRVGELCALKWRDINFIEGTISITKTLYSPDNNTKSYFLETPKTKSSRRDIEVDPSLLDTLENHRSAQNIVRMRHRKTYVEEDFVFARDGKFAGYPIIPKKIGERMKRLLKLATLNTNLSTHSLRHTHTSLMAEAGVSLETIMERLGHQNDTITRNVYLHVTKSVKKEASRKFAELMRSL